MSKREIQFALRNAGNIVPENSKRSRKQTPVNPDFVMDSCSETFLRDNDQPTHYCATTEDANKDLMQEEFKMKATLIALCYVRVVAVIESLHCAESSISVIHEGKKLNNACRLFGLFVECIQDKGDAMLNARYREKHGKDVLLNASNAHERDPSKEITSLFPDACQQHIVTFLTENNAASALEPKTKNFRLDGNGAKLVHGLAQAKETLSGLMLDNKPQDVLAKLKRSYKDMTTACSVLEKFQQSIASTPRQASFPFDTWKLTLHVLRQDDAAIGSVLWGGKITLIYEYISAMRKKQRFGDEDAAVAAGVPIYQLKLDVCDVLVKELGKLCNNDLLEYVRNFCHPHLKTLQ